jgi:hypothetical protein
MKKYLLIFTLAVILTLMVTSVAMATPGGNPRGVVTGIDGDTLTILKSDGTSLIVTVPSGIPDGIAEGMTVMVKGNYTADGFVADWVRQVGNDDADEEEEDDSEGNGNAWAWGEGGAYCNGGKDRPHPVAAKIAEQYGVDAEWVMSHACDGHGFGGVMLALQSQQAGGEGGESAEGYLNQRKQGKGWGQLWKEGGLVGNPSAGSPPPGLLKKQFKDNGPPPGKGWRKYEDADPDANGLDADNDTDPEGTGDEGGDPD